MDRPVVGEQVGAGLRGTVGRPDPAGRDAPAIVPDPQLDLSGREDGLDGAHVRSVDVGECALCDHRAARGQAFETQLGAGAAGAAGDAQPGARIGAGAAEQLDAQRALLGADELARPPVPARSQLEVEVGPLLREARGEEVERAPRVAGPVRGGGRGARGGRSCGEGQSGGRRGEVGRARHGVPGTLMASAEATTAGAGSG